MLQSNVLSDVTKRFCSKAGFGYSNDALIQDLTRLHKIFCDFQSSRVRDTVYLYLAAVFDLVQWWSADNRASSRALRAFQTHGIKAPDAIEPYAAVIITTAFPTKLDKRTISKYARVLRYAERFKSNAESLQTFVRRKGGLNACAARYAKRLGRSRP
jgi:hypothetical protein